MPKKCLPSLFANFALPQPPCMTHPSALAIVSGLGEASGRRMASGSTRLQEEETSISPTTSSGAMVYWVCVRWNGYVFKIDNFCIILMHKLPKSYFGLQKLIYFDFLQRKLFKNYQTNVRLKNAFQAFLLILLSTTSLHDPPRSPTRNTAFNRSRKPSQ